MPSMTKQL